MEREGHRLFLSPRSIAAADVLHLHIDLRGVVVDLLTNLRYVDLYASIFSFWAFFLPFRSFFDRDEAEMSSTAIRTMARTIHCTVHVLLDAYLLPEAIEIISSPRCSSRGRISRYYL